MEVSDGWSIVVSTLLYILMIDDCCCWEHWGVDRALDIRQGWYSQIVKQRCLVAWNCIKWGVVIVIQFFYVYLRKFSQNLGALSNRHFSSKNFAQYLRSTSFRKIFLIKHKICINYILFQWDFRQSKKSSYKHWKKYLNRPFLLYTEHSITIFLSFDTFNNIFSYHQ